jgi:hypothetical protein
MNTSIEFKSPLSRGLRTAGAGLLAAGFLIFATACSDLLDITDPDIVVPENLQGPQGADLFWGGAIGDFASAYSANNGGQAVYVGLFTDEYHLSGTFPTRIEIDRREVDKLNGTLGGEFNRIHTARQATRSAAEFLAEVDASDTRIAEMWNLNAYTYVFMGENYCSGVPISEPDESGEIVPGPQFTTTELFERAIDRFDQALAAAQDDDQRRLARVGKARALMSLNRYSEAAALVTESNVPTDWEYAVKHSSNSGRQENSNYDLTFQGRWSVSDLEGGNGVTFRDGDPRTPSILNGNGFDEQTPQHEQLKFGGYAADVVLASGLEARLIEAEAAMASAPATWLAKHNQVRATIGLDPLSDPGSADARVTAHFDERARWFFGDGHRLGDLRRLIRQYGRTEDQVFPTGEFFKGGPYGNDVNFIIPQEEENNPNFEQCLDRNA